MEPKLVQLKWKIQLETRWQGKVEKVRFNSQKASADEIAESI